MAGLQDVESAIAGLRAELAGSPTFGALPLSESELAALGVHRGWARARGTLGSWATQAGAYVLLRDGVVEYVGRALKGQGLASRLREHARAAPFAGADDGAANRSVAVIPLPDDLAWLAPSLELWVHWKVRDGGGLLNRKRC
jgi:hypothetical protein